MLNINSSNFQQQFFLNNHNNASTEQIEATEKQRPNKQSITKEKNT